MEPQKDMKSSSASSSGINLSTFVIDRFQFAEMNIRHTGNLEKTLVMVRRAIRMGYDSIVINTDIGDPDKDIEDSLEADDGPPKKKKKKKGRNINKENAIPDPVVIDSSLLDTSSLAVAGKKLRLFSRLTVTLSDSTAVHNLMHHPQLKKYDVIAVRPSSEQILQTLARKGDFVDIVTYEQTSDSIPWLFKTKLLQQCVSEGLTFEITYAEALKDSSGRRQVLTNGRQLMLGTRGGRGVVIASGAESMIEIRGPFDTANLAVLFGIRAEDARKFVAGNARKALLRAMSRKTIKGAMVVTAPGDLPTRSGDKGGALEKLMKISEFSAQIELSEKVEKINEEE